MNREEREHLSRVVDLGCILCGGIAEIHHIRAGQGRKRASHFEVLPLCHPHHRTGGYGVAYHAGAKAWVKNFGTERELLERVREQLGIEIA